MAREKAFDRKRLMREIERDRRQKTTARLKELRDLIRAARVSRREAIKGIKVQCRTARVKLRSVCSMRAERAKTEGELAVAARRRELERETAEEKQTRRAIARSEGRAALSPTVRKTSAKERREESDDAVRSNIPRELVAVFDKVRRHIHGDAWKDRTDAFLQWAHDNPGEVYAIQSEQAERELAKLIAEQQRAERKLHRGRSRGALALADEVPF